MNPLGKPVLLITGNGVRRILVYSDKHFDDLNEYINELKDSYLSSSLISGNGDVDFDDPTYQACYVFLYFPVLCYGTFYGLLECYNKGNLEILLKTALNSGSLRVCSLGGGPGTDLFGVRMFLNNWRRCENVSVHATVLDKHREWQIAFQCLSSELTTCNMSANYLRLEVGGHRRNDIHPDHVKAIANADLITCSKFISAVRVLANSRTTLIRLLNQAKSNAYLFYLENSKGGNTEFFSSVAQSAGFTEVICFERGEDNPFQLPNMENSKYLGDLPRWFDFNSQRNLRVTFMLWRKISKNATSPSTRQIIERADPQHEIQYVPSSSAKNRPTSYASCFDRQTDPESRISNKSSKPTHPIRQHGTVIHSARNTNTVPHRGVQIDSPNESNSRHNRQHRANTPSTSSTRPKSSHHVIDLTDEQCARMRANSARRSPRDLEAQRNAERSCCPCILL